MRALAVGAVTDQRMADVLEVTTDLMAAPGLGCHLDQGITGTRMASVDTEWPFKTGTQPPAGSRGPHELTGRRTFRVAGQRMLNQAIRRRPATHQGQIMFADRA